MRIALDVRAGQEALRTAPDGGLGGVGRYALSLTETLLERREPGREYVLLVDRGEIPARIHEIARSAGVPLRAVGGARLQRRARWSRFGPFEHILDSVQVGLALRRLGVDLVHHLDQAVRPFWFGPALTTLHDTTPLSRGSRASPAGLLGAVSRFLQRRSLRADGVLCVSSWLRDDALRRVAAEPHRVHVGHPGVDTTVFTPVGPEASAHDPYLLHVGALRPLKNPSAVVSAFASVACDHPDLQLVCVGVYDAAGNARQIVHDLACASGIDSRVHVMPPPRDDHQLAALYRGARALLFPSFQEGFGFPVAEALACGTPVVASNRGSLCEVGGPLALYAPPDDVAGLAAHLRTCLTDEEHRARMRREGPLWASRFSWSAVAAEAERLYAEIVPSWPGTRAAATSPSVGETA